MLTEALLLAPQTDYELILEIATPR
jgi:hypothetical protein